MMLSSSSHGSFRIQLTKFLVLPSLIFTSLIVWVDSGYPGISIEKKYGAPFFADARCVKESTYCESPLKDILSADNILVGDSEAVSMVSSFRNMGFKYKFSSAVRARSGCSFMFEAYEGNQGKECQTFVRETYHYLKSSSSKRIYIYNRIDKFNITKYANFFESLLVNGNQIIILGSPLPLKFGFSAYTNMIRSVPIGTPKSFFKEDFDYTNLPTQLRLISNVSDASNPRIQFFPTYNLFCPKYPCSLKSKSGKWFYSDPTHLSPFGIDFLLGRLRKARFI